MGSEDQYLEELGALLTSYGKRITILRESFLASGEEQACKISSDLDAILRENERIYKRLKDAIAAGHPDVLENVWNLSHMKEIYHPLLNDAKKSITICDGWKARPDIAVTLESKGFEKEEICVTLKSFPTILVTHLVQVCTLLGKYYSEVNPGRASKVSHRFEELIKWLDAKPPSVKSLVPSVQTESSDEVVLKHDTLRLPRCSSKDAEEAVVILTNKRVIIQIKKGSILKSETVEQETISKIDAEEAYDNNLAFEISGVGLRKRLHVDCSQKHHDWLHSIREVKALA